MVTGISDSIYNGILPLTCEAYHVSSSKFSINISVVDIQNNIKTATKSSQETNWKSGNSNFASSVTLHDVIIQEYNMLRCDAEDGKTEVEHAASIQCILPDRNYRCNCNCEYTSTSGNIYSPGYLGNIPYEKKIWIVITPLKLGKMLDIVI